MKRFTKYVWLGYTAARANLAYVGEVISRTVFLAVMLFIFMKLWIVVYGASTTDRLGGLTLAQMLWYLMVTESIFMSVPRVWAEVDLDVRTGRLAVQLIHPLSYVLGHLSRSTGERVARFTINMLAGSVIALLFIGPIPLTAKGLLMFLAILPMAFLLDFLGNFLVGLCAFWMESTTGLALLYSRVTMMLGGVLLPLELYPESMQELVRRLPFASMIYAPGRMFVNPSPELLWESVLIQGGASVALGGLVLIVQTIALRRLFANGG